MENIKRILVVSRRTKFCQETINYGIALAWKHGAELFIIHLGCNPGELKELGLPSTETDSAIVFLSAEPAVDKALMAAKIGGLCVKELFRGCGPVEEIMKTIHEEGIDLLVLSPRGETRLEQLLFGSMTEELQLRKPCPIILAKKVEMDPDHP